MATLLTWLLTAAAVFGTAAAVLVYFPETPLPDEWNPSTPLSVAAPLSPLTGWKMKRAAQTENSCLAALKGEGVRSKSPLEHENTLCGIDPRVVVTRIGQSSLRPVETTCSIALRLAMWERHGLQPAAQKYLGTSVAKIEHQSSFACRAIRTSTGSSTRMSAHATGEAIDVKGFELADGRTVSLLRDWNDEGEKSSFLHAARNSSCTWFATTLGPDYNSLHADHFHLQSRGWGLCR